MLFILQASNTVVLTDCHQKGLIARLLGSFVELSLLLSSILQVPAPQQEDKQEELGVCACLQGYDLIGVTEMWWDGCYDWSVGMEGYRLLRKDRQGR